jgi:hypothetical protein
MKRFLQLVALVSFTSYTASAQDLAYKIPEKAFSVVSIKSNQLFQLCPANEFNNSTLGKKFLEKLSETANESYKSIEELGLNLSANAYYYYQVTDSINYHGLIIPLTDGSKIDALFSKHADSIRKINGISVLQRPDQKTVIAWNNQMLYLTYGSLNNYFFSDSAHAATYGDISAVYDDYPASDVVVDTVVATKIEEEGVQAESAEDIINKGLDSTIVKDPDFIYDEAPADSTLPVPEDTSAPIVFDYGTGEAVPAEETEAYYVEKKRIRDSLTVSWLTTSTQQIFDKTSASPSILNNPGYVRSADNNAIATFWMMDIQSVYSAFFPYKYFMKYGGNFMRGYGNVNARLYMGKEQIRLSGEMGLDTERAASYSKICDHKLNKKFLKYIKGDSLIGFMSYAFNTEAYMYEMPKLLGGAYSYKYEEEMALVTDLMTVMLDEKAIAKVIKGDALFLLTNLTEKQVTYQSYEYNEETFEYKDTVKTKTETLPDFLCMFSSDDTHLIERLLQYGIKKEKIVFSNGIYVLEQTGKNPFNLHLLIKDGIVFLGTSLQDITQIQDGSFKGNLDKQHRDLLTKNNMTMFFSPKSLGHKMPVHELGEAGDKMTKLLGGAGNVYITSAGIKDGYISMDMTADVPKEKENALKYFLDLVEDMSNLK